MKRNENSVKKKLGKLTRTSSQERVCWLQLAPALGRVTWVAL